MSENYVKVTIEMDLTAWLERKNREINCLSEKLHEKLRESND